MRYTHIFFDLDGTLFDSGPGVKNAYQYALRGIGKPVPPHSELDFVLGPPLYWSFREKTGLTEEETQRAVALYRQYYKTDGMWQCSVYEGMEQLLRTLHGAGVHLGVVTGKPQQPADAMLRHFGLLPLLDFVVGSGFDETAPGKKGLLQRAFALAGLPSQAPAGALMVGDRCFDIDGARETGIDSMGVLFGYGTREELCAHGATLLAATPAEALALLCG